MGHFDNTELGEATEETRPMSHAARAQEVGAVSTRMEFAGKPDARREAVAAEAKRQIVLAVAQDRRLTRRTDQ